MQLAKFVGDIAVGEVQETPQAPDTPATESRRKGGLRGGRARAKKLSARKRREIAKRQLGPGGRKGQDDHHLHNGKLQVGTVERGEVAIENISPNEGIVPIWGAHNWTRDECEPEEVDVCPVNTSQLTWTLYPLDPCVSNSIEG